MVRAAGSVCLRGDGDVVDCAIKGEVDGKFRILAVISCEFGVCEGDFALLNVLAGLVFGWI